MMWRVAETKRERVGGRGRGGGGDRQSDRECMHVSACVNVYVRLSDFFYLPV